MRARSRLGGAVGLAVVALSLAVAGCGFDDQLTRRGFIEEGDALCDASIGRTAQQLQQAGAGDDPASQEREVRVLADGYSSIAAGLEGLELSDEDAAMRDAMVERYSRAALEIDEAASDAGGGDPAARERALGVIEGLLPFARRVREYGFEICGGRAAT